MRGAVFSAQHKLAPVGPERGKQSDAADSSLLDPLPDSRLESGNNHGTRKARAPNLRKNNKPIVSMGEGNPWKGLRPPARRYYLGQHPIWKQVCLPYPVAPIQKQLSS